MIENIVMSFVDVVRRLNRANELHDREVIMYVNGEVEGYIRVAELLGYVLSANHRDGLVGLEYDSVSVATHGKVLMTVSI